MSDNTSNEQSTVYGDKPSEWEKDGAASLVSHLAEVVFGLASGDIGLVRGILDGSTPVAVLTLSRPVDDEHTATTPIAVLLMGDSGARVVERITFPDMPALSKNPDYEPAPAA